MSGENCAQRSSPQRNFSHPHSNEEETKKRPQRSERRENPFSWKQGETDSACAVQPSKAKGVSVCVLGGIRKEGFAGIDR